MGQIKSALELALERTAEIKSDKTAIETKETKDNGRRAASQFLNGELDEDGLKKQLKSLNREKLAWYAEGCFETFTANLTLPQTEGFEPLVEKVHQGLVVLLGEKKHIDHLFSQITQFFSQYLENRTHIEEQLTAQYEPMLRRKEQELSRQTGTQIRLSPMQDPEFVKQYQHHIGQLEKQYTDVLSQAKAQMRDMLS
ncbi:MAG: hypothetical protein JXB03_10590 [Spirochaetales bacterium]|nr:hypothetical protein [Spirochaetales bacterium]